MDPVKVLRLARAMGGHVGRALVVGCEPTPCGDYEEMQPEMSEPVRSAVDEAVGLVESLATRLVRGEHVGAS
jgi:hydrogenase maturation protease